MQVRPSIALLMLSVLITSCTFARKASILPTPETSCSVNIDWRGIKPGKSTREEVLETLGVPDHEGAQSVANQRVSFYAYSVEGGVVARFAQDRVYFRSDGVVDWIEVVVADRDGGFHPIQEMIDELGAMLDTGYVNNNYRPSTTPQFDVLAGPDQVYVWSECGVAVHMFTHCFVLGSDDLHCALPNEVNQSEEDEMISVTFRHPEAIDSLKPIVTANNAMLMKFLFPPTSYKGFTTFYKNKIPFGMWDAYIQEVPPDS